MLPDGYFAANNLLLHEMCDVYLKRLYSSAQTPRSISNAKLTKMMTSTKVFLGFERMETSGGPVERGVPEWVEDAARIPVLVVGRVVLGHAWGRQSL